MNSTDTSELLWSTVTTLPEDDPQHNNRLVEQAHIQLMILYTMFALIVGGNLIVLLALFSVRHKKSRLNFFVKHLAVADLMVGFLNALPEIIRAHRKAFYAGLVGCKLLKFTQQYVVYASIYQMVALSLDRFFAIVFPMDFVASRKRVTVMATAAWVLPAAFSTPTFFIWTTKEVYEVTQCVPPLLMKPGWQYMVIGIYQMFMSFYLPLVILCICYCTMISVIWKRGRTMAPPIKSDRNGNSSGKGGKYTSVSKTGKSKDFNHRSSSRGIIPKAKVKTVKMTICIVVAYLLCWIPTVLFYTLESFNALDREKLRNPEKPLYWISIIVQNLLYLNSATNPFIYGFFSSNICRELRRYYIVRQILRYIPCCSSAHPQKRPNFTNTYKSDTLMTEMHTQNMSDSRRERSQLSSCEEKYTSPM